MRSACAVDSLLPHGGKGVHGTPQRGMILSPPNKKHRLKFGLFYGAVRVVPHRTALSAAIE